MDKTLTDHDTDGHTACMMGRPRTPPAGLGPRAANAWLSGWDAYDREPRLPEDAAALDARRAEHAAGQHAVRCACGATLTVRSPRRVTHLGLWCGHIDVTATTGDFRSCSGRDAA